jgi:7-cyano-7-deazaguanine reductase
MQIPDLSGYQEAYRNLEHELETLGDNDPATLLISFPMGDSNRVQVTSITCTFEELTAFCPWTRFPDQGTLVINYTPGDKLLELKSLKYYLLAFRDRHITQEHLCQKIAEDLQVELAPQQLHVTLDYMPRGGIHTVIALNA